MTCSKITYQTKKEADDDIKLIKANSIFRSKKIARAVNGKSGKKLRAYKCRHCGLWHLTSQPIKRKY